MKRDWGGGATTKRDPVGGLPRRARDRGGGTKIDGGKGGDHEEISRGGDDLVGEIVGGVNYRKGILAIDWRLQLIPTPIGILFMKPDISIYGRGIFRFDILI